MRLLSAVAALVVAATLAVPAEATTPHPSSCTAVAQGAVVLPANPADLVASAAVVTYGAEVRCLRDPLTTPPVDHLTPYVGHLSLELRAQDGTLLCGGNPDISGVFQSVSSLLVMANHHTCVVPITQEARTQPMYVRTFWATMPPYICCPEHVVPITPAGVG